MVRDARVMRSTDLIETLVRSIPKEPSAYNVNNMFLYLGGCIENFCPANRYDEYMTSCFDMIYNELKTETDANKISKFKTMLCSYAWSNHSLEVLSEWIQGKNEVLSKFTPTLPEKYKIVSYLFARSIGTQEWRDGIRAEVEASDKTDMKKEYGYVIAAMTADKDQREVLWADYMNPKCELSYHMLAMSCAGFNSKWVPYELREPYFERYYANILDVLKNRSRKHAEEIFRCLVPAYKDCNQSVLRNAELMKSVKELDMFWQKNLKDTNDSDLRKQRVLNFAEQHEKL